MEFETETFTIETSIGENIFNVNYGNLPNTLSALLSKRGAEAILDFDFLINSNLQ